MRNRCLYKTCMAVGRFSGCHQRADRSFFIHGKQFPVCARCTGAFMGECLAIVIFHFFRPPVIFLMSLCAVMFLDWFIQYLKIRESTNIRRVITGFLGGYGYFSLVLKAIFIMKRVATANLMLSN